jgi:hypothetical protein
MVSPLYKEDYPATPTAISDDGSQILVATFGNILTPQGALPEGTGLFGHSYRLVRTEAGWGPVPLDAPSSRFPNFEAWSMSSDFRSSLLFASVPGQSSADVYLDPSGGPMTYVGPGAPPGTVALVLTFMGASEDLSHSVFVVRSANAGLEEEHLWPGDTTFGERRLSLYEYTGTGNSEPGLVGISDEHKIAHIGESHLISNCGTAFGSFPNPGGDAYNAISASGDTIFFTAKECGGTPPTNEIYARIDREKTVALSEPSLSVPGRVCTAACAMTENTPGSRKPGAFAGASLDGSSVFFMTQQSLVDEDEQGKGAGMDLYEAEIAEGAVTRLAQVSRGGNGDAHPGSGAEVSGVARVSEDGSHVYFVAQGVLTGANREGRSPVANAPNLYVVARECTGGQATCGDPVERTSFVATLAINDGADWGVADSRPVQATPDGRFLVFASTADLTPDQEGRKEAGQIFEYDAQTETLVRISRGQDGYNEDGNSETYAATIPSQYYGEDRPSTHFSNLVVSADGSRVFFSSRDALTPQALEGVGNVYEYHEGQIALVSDGHDVLSPNGAELIGTDESGRDVFFTTADRLLPQETDGQVEIYDARADGGFPAPVEAAPCSGDSCQGAVGTAPSLPVSASTSTAPEAAGGTSTSSVSPKPRKASKKKTKRHKPAAKKHKGKKTSGKRK